MRTPSTTANLTAYKTDFINGVCHMDLVNAQLSFSHFGAYLGCVKSYVEVVML